MAKERIPTGRLLQRLFKTKSLQRFIRTYDEEMVRVPFCVYLGRLCADRGVKPERIIKKSDIDRNYGHQIFNGARKPSRDNVIKLAFGFEMDYDETQELLKMARKSTLYIRIERDAVIIYALKNNYSIDDIQVTLADLGLPILGKEEKYE